MERCLICGEMRDEQVIAEFVKDIGLSKGQGAGKTVSRVRYCTDREKCIEKAQEIMRK